MPYLICRSYLSYNVCVKWEKWQNKSYGGHIWIKESLMANVWKKRTWWKLKPWRFQHDQFSMPRAKKQNNAPIFVLKSCNTKLYTSAKKTKKYSYSNRNQKMKQLIVNSFKKPFKTNNKHLNCK